MYMYVHVRSYEHLRAYGGVCITCFHYVYLYVYLFVFVYVCVRVFVYVCVCGYAGIHTMEGRCQDLLLRGPLPPKH